MTLKVESVTQSAIAEILGVTTERVRQLVHDGLPQVDVGGKRKYVPRDVIRWLRERDKEQARRDVAGGADESASKARKTAAEADLKELELAERRRELIPSEEYQTQLDALVGGFAAVALGRLQQFERKIVSVRDAPGARLLTQQMTEALMQGAQDYAETLEQSAEAA